MKKFSVFLLCFLSLFSLFGCKKKENLNSLSKNLTNYDININLDCENKSAFINEKVKYVNTSDQLLKNVQFQLYPQFFKDEKFVVSPTKLNQAYPNGIDYCEFNISRVCVNGQDANINYLGEMDNILNINLIESLFPNEIVEIDIDFSFTLPNCQHRFGYGKNTINLGNFYPIACVFEDGKFSTNPYNANGDPFYSDMANYFVKINLDKEYIVAGTGNCTDQAIKNGKKEISFSAKMVRDFALIISNKFKVLNEKFNNISINYYYFKDEFCESSLKTAVDAIKTFSNLFGDYPYENFSVVQADFIYGGMEYPNLVMISESIENSDDYKNVIIHETAHQWWYGMVGNDEFTYPWLDESLTEYSTILFYDNNNDYSFNHEQMVKSCLENYSLFVTVYNDVLGNIDTSMRAINLYETEPEYTYCTYVKGVLMWDSLYQLIGKKEFLKCLKNYFNEYKFKIVKPNDLINSLSKTSKTDLSNFFASWLDGKVVIR